MKYILSASTTLFVTVLRFQMGISQNLVSRNQIVSRIVPLSKKISSILAKRNVVFFVIFIIFLDLKNILLDIFIEDSNLVIIT